MNSTIASDHVCLSFFESDQEKEASLKLEDAEWQRRTRKRDNAVNHILKTADYVSMRTLFAEAEGTSRSHLLALDVKA